MLNCIVCSEEITQQLSWSNLFSGQQASNLCETCQSQLKFLELTGRCEQCFGIIDSNECKDCSLRRFKKVSLVMNRSVYAYQPVVRDLIARWKYRGDYVIADEFKEVFRERFEFFYGEIKNPVIVPIPLHEDRLKDRAFNQALQIASYLPRKIRMILQRKTGEKQAKKSRTERLTSENPFIAKETIKNNVILVDDIYTTGTTVHHAAEALRNAGAKSVSSMTLIRG